MSTQPATDDAIVAMTEADWPEVRRIYAEGITTGHATFETEIPGWDTWDRRHLTVGRLVARRRGVVLGWVALSLYSTRAVYAGVAEVSLYVAEEARGQGLGRRLLEALIAASEAAGIWTLQAGIFPENTASVVLHMRCGFRLVGRREKLGRMHGRWRDVLLLERRSSLVGT